jgi:DNA mismatch repair protein MSH5
MEDAKMQRFMIWLHSSELISIHELARLLDEEMTDQEQADLEDAEGICRRFLAWDLDADQEDDVRTKLGSCLGRKNLDEDEEY